MITFSEAPADPKQAYIDLIKRTIMGWPYAQNGYKVTEKDRVEGRDWPDIAHTLLSLSRLNNIEECINKIIADNVPGDFMECGIWRGGALLLMQAMVHINGLSRNVIGVDSFAGVPPPTMEIDSRETFHNYRYLSVGKDEVQEIFKRYGFQATLIKGWFKGVLPNWLGHLSLLRADGDLYESTYCVLDCLYPKLSVGGFFICDDYECMPHVRQACWDYRKAHDIHDFIHIVDWSAAFWRKTK